MIDSVPRRRDMRISTTLALGRSPYGLSLPLIFGLGVYALIASHGGSVLHLSDTSGWAGLVPVTAFCAAAAVAMLLRQLLRSLVPVHAMIATALAVTLVIPHVLARPHVFTLPILVAWAAGLVRARCENRAPAARLASMMVLWANLQGGYLFGLGLVGLLAAEAVLLAPDWRTRRQAAGGWGFFVVLAVT